MTIPDWLQAIQNYMKTLQYPSNQGLSRLSQGMGKAIVSLVACLSPVGQQMLSKVGEAGQGGMPLCESPGVMTEDVIDQALLPLKQLRARMARRQ